jgi:hypothetical protein
MDVTAGDPISLEPDPDLSAYNDLAEQEATIAITYTWNFYNVSDGCADPPTTYPPLYTYIGPDGTEKSLPQTDEDVPATWDDTNKVIIHNPPSFDFYAPADIGCYEVGLTMSVHVEYTVDSKTLVLDEPCVDWECWTICTSPAPCPMCSDIFCEDECPLYPTTAGDAGICEYYDQSQEYNPNGPGICYRGDTSGLSSTQVKWYILDEDTYNTWVASYTNAEIANLLELETARNSAFCFDETWCSSYGPGRYQLVMAVWSADLTDIVSWCSVGAAVEVAEPTASIGEVVV